MFWFHKDDLGRSSNAFFELAFIFYCPKGWIKCNLASQVCSNIPKWCLPWMLFPIIFPLNALFTMSDIHLYHETIMFSGDCSVEFCDCCSTRFQVGLSAGYRIWQCFASNHCICDTREAHSRHKGASLCRQGYCCVEKEWKFKTFSRQGGPFQSLELIVRWILSRFFLSGLRGNNNWDNFKLKVTIVNRNVKKALMIG